MKKVITVGLVLLTFLSVIVVLGKGKPPREGITIEVSEMVGFSDGSVTYEAPYREGESFDGGRWVVLVDSPQLMFLIDGKWVSGVIDTLQRREERDWTKKGKSRFTKWAVGVNTEAGRYCICQCNLRDLITSYDESTETWYVEFNDACMRDYYDGTLYGTVSFSFRVRKIGSS